MNRSTERNRKVQQEPKLSFGSALKQNVRIFLIIITIFKVQFKNTNSAGKKSKKSGSSKGSGNKKQNYQTIPVSKIDESYNTDKGPDILNSKEDINEFKGERKGYLQDIPSEDSSVFNSKKVKIYFL